MGDDLLTILFTDVEGSTALHVSKGDAEARRILGACDEVIRHQVREHGGREIKSTGDGFMIAFTSPRRAVACALAIQETSTARGQQVRVRAGVHTGEVSEEAGDLFGGAVNAAARICAKAQGGEVLVSDVVRQLCGTSGDVSWRERGVVRLRGFPERWRLYQAVSPVRGTSVGERTPFVGREAELAELRRLMQQALAGHGGLVMIGGEPGVGKSRLNEEIAAEARGRGFLALTGHCYASQAGLPYMPWVEMVETAARDADFTEMRQAMGEAAPELARIVPQLRHTFSDIPPPLELPPEQQRRYTFSCLSDYVARVARARPRLYVLEDLHWADDSTLLFLEHLAERLSTIPVLIVGTYRDPPIDVSPILAEALSGLVRRRQARLLSLQRHSASEVAAMLQALSGHAPPPEVSSAIHTETEGNAFFVEEVYRYLAETGRLLDQRGHFRSDLRIEELDVPRNVQLVTRQRLDRLTPPTRQLLTAGAVIGRHFRLEILEALAEMPESDILDAVDEAERAGVLVAEPVAATTQLRFSHEIVRQTLLAGLSPPRRQRYHLRVADVLERHWAGDADRHAADIAHHLLTAGAGADADRTVHHLRLAAEQALARAAFEDSLRHLEAALDLSPARNSRQRTDLLFTRGLALRGAGRWDEAMAAWEEALHLGETLRDDAVVAHLCAEMAMNYFWSGRMPEAVEIAGRGLKGVGDTLSADRAILLGTTGFAHSYAGDFPRADDLTASAVVMAEGFDDRRVLGYALNLRSIHHFMWQQCAECIAHGLRAAEVLRAAGDVFLLANDLCIVEHALLWLGRVQEARLIGEEVGPLAERIGHHGAIAVERSVRLYGEILGGRLDAVESSAAHLLAMSRQHGLGFIADYHTLLGLAAFWRGDWERGLTSCEEGRRATIPGVLAGAPWAFSFLIRAYTGDDRSALKMLDDAPVLSAPGEPLSISGLTAVRALVEGLVVLGRHQQASHLYPLVRARIEEGLVLSHWDMRLLHAIAGLAAAAGRRWEVAEEHYLAAQRQASELPHRLDEPEVGRFYAMMLIDRGGTGDAAVARGLLQEATAGYRAIGMPRHEAMAQELLARAEAAVRR